LPAINSQKSLGDGYADFIGLEGNDCTIASNNTEILPWAVLLATGFPFGGGRAGRSLRVVF
jgi:hypothetical protein